MPRLHLGDGLRGLQGLGPSSVDLTLTSPPFGNIREFGGHRLTTEIFEGVATELWRTTRPGGVVCWQEGDEVLKEGAGKGGYSGLSWRHVHHFQDLGFLLWDVIITGSVGKRFPIPRRYSRPPVYISVLTKGEPETVNLLRDRKNKTAGQVFRHNERRSDGSLFLRSKGYVVPPYGARTTIWLYPTGHKVTTDRTEHPALMHEALARDLVRGYSRRGDLVCDPFAGACTTGKMAVLLGRDFVGWEIHPPYHATGERRLHAAIDHARREALRSLVRGSGQATSPGCAKRAGDSETGSPRQ